MPLPSLPPEKAEKPEKPDDRPLYARLFDWKSSGPYRWKEGFPLKPVLRARHRLPHRPDGEEGAEAQGSLDLAPGLDDAPPT